MTLKYYIEMAQQVRLSRVSTKLWNYVKFRAYPRKVRMSVTRYTPQIGGLLVTMRCNLKCGYCNIANKLTETKKHWQDYEATLQKVQEIFRNPLFSECILVDLLGGEPLLVRDFDRIINYLSQRGHLTNTSTNGILLADRVGELRKAGISRINVSLYEANRAALEQNIEKINNVFPVHMSYVLLRSEVAYKPQAIMDAVRFACETGCRSIRFWMYRPMGESPDFSEIIADNDPAYIALRREIESMFPNFCVWPTPVQKDQIKKLCPQVWQRVSCNMLGDMGICCGSEDNLQGLYSNLFAASPDEVFNHSTLIRMRTQLLDPALGPPHICRTCNLLGDPGW